MPPLIWGSNYCIHECQRKHHRPSLGLIKQASVSKQPYNFHSQSKHKLFVLKLHFSMHGGVCLSYSLLWTNAWITVSQWYSRCLKNRWHFTMMEKYLRICHLSIPHLWMEVCGTIFWCNSICVIRWIWLWLVTFSVERRKGFIPLHVFTQKSSLCREESW